MRALPRETPRLRARSESPLSSSFPGGIALHQPLARPDDAVFDQRIDLRVRVAVLRAGPRGCARRSTAAARGRAASLALMRSGLRGHAQSAHHVVLEVEHVVAGEHVRVLEHLLREVHGAAGHIGRVEDFDPLRRCRVRETPPPSSPWRCGAPGALLRRTSRSADRRRSDHRCRGRRGERGAAGCSDRRRRSGRRASRRRDSSCCGRAPWMYSRRSFTASSWRMPSLRRSASSPRKPSRTG